MTTSAPLPQPAALSLLVKCTAGMHPDEAERCNQALTVAATAAASGIDVSLWLTGEAVWLAVPGRAECGSLPHGRPFIELLDTITATGSLTVCSQCAARRNLAVDDVLPGAVIAGAASFVAAAMDSSTQVLVY